ncbi:MULTISPECIES: SRPBCC family protein [Streptomyces]|uniref:SRPBCC family protein n=1 Tax=Streptomyces TaxID=1883 RepID=UPI0016775DAE|nr:MULTISPECIES: SRPBCC family protein [Streptomyces]MBK3523749.1 SRPBCC family protein [Streptomyces sp. MBT70]GGR81116.1 MxaD family protein [Streptomyces eurythermus]
MASTSVSRTVPASPEKVWSLIGGFDALPDWLPYIPESTALEGGRVRRLKNPEGEVIIERLVDFNEAERHYSYAILQAPFPVNGYVSTLRVHAIPGQEDAAEVQWSGRFNPDGATEDEVVDLFTGIYRDGLEALHKTLAA